MLTIGRRKSIVVAVPASVLAVACVFGPTLPATSAPNVAKSAMAVQLGCRDIQPSSITTFDDGGQDYHFTTPGGEIDMPVPPAGFRPLTASPEALSRYGFPPQPSDNAHSADWHTAMAAYKGTAAPAVCWNDTLPSGPVGLQRTEAPVVNQVWVDGNPTWAGYVAIPGSGNTYVETEGNFVQPSRGSSTCANAAESAWVGIGGYKVRSDNTSGLIQEGTTYGPTGVPYPWYEYVESDSNGNFVAGIPAEPLSLTIHVGDTIQAETSYSPSSHNAEFRVTDLTTGIGSIMNMTVDPKYYDGTAGDFIIERPKNLDTGNSYDLQNFSTANFSQATVLNQKGTSTYLGATPNQEEMDMQGPGGAGADYHTMAYPLGIIGTNQGAFNVKYLSCN